jgi:hypothetical protein
MFQYGIFVAVPLSSVQLQGDRNHLRFSFEFGVLNFVTVAMATIFGK